MTNVIGTPPWGTKEGVAEILPSEQSSGLNWFRIAGSVILQKNGPHQESRSWHTGQQRNLPVGMKIACDEKRLPHEFGAILLVEG